MEDMSIIDGEDNFYIAAKGAGVLDVGHVACLNCSVTCHLRIDLTGRLCKVRCPYGKARSTLLV